jgi:transcriptional regulator NrdR family protein
MTMVLKRNKSLQDFDSGKIRRAIEAAAREASLPEKRVSDLVEGISRRTAVKYQWEPQVPTSAIREDILRMMDETEPAAARLWRVFERTHKDQN